MTIQFEDRRSKETATLTKALLAVLAALIVGTAIALLVVPFEPAGATSQFIRAYMW